MSRGWAVDEAALRRALAFLGIKTKVRIVLKRLGLSPAGVPAFGQTEFSGREYADGSVDLDPPVVSVDTTYGAEVASLALWHELTHVAQHERIGVVEAATLYSRREQEYGYDNNPDEVEARHVAETMHALLPLTKMEV